MKNLIIRFLIRIGVIKPTFYINGPETLPPPLSADEERELLIKKR